MKTDLLRIDFAPGARRVRGGVWTLLAGAAFALALAAAQVASLQSERADAQSSSRRLADARGGAPAAAPRQKNDAHQLALAREVRQVTGQLLTPWAALLSSLGAVPTSDVALLAVEPSVARHAVRLTAEARDAGAMLGYVGALQRDPRLSSVVLVSHQLQSQAPGTPLRFQVQADWGDAR